jgi:predicted short-subunit dehydrogenase-like oxidoreductase (DUF2520 family)
MKTLNVIGAGRVGRTLATLWAQRSTFALQDVLDGTPAGAQAAVVFIGAGKALDKLETMRAADVWMLTTPDRVLCACSERLAAVGLVRAGDVVFHCSGSLDSGELAAAAACGASVCSVHPLKTFADPAQAVRTFAGTHCAAEGDRAALDVLTAAFEQIGARVSQLDARSKTIYHAASVMVCNYLTALIEAGLRCYHSASIPRDIAMDMIAPIVSETVANVFRLGPAGALTGPIARGDSQIVERHMQALGALDPRLAAIYRDLGCVALDLAKANASTDSDALARVAALLNTTR